MKKISIVVITVALVVGMIGCGSTPSGTEIRDWYDLDAVRDNLSGSYILMNDLDSTTAGYDELASETASMGMGWKPIGNVNATFTGGFDGQGLEIKNLFINRPDEEEVGLFGHVGEGGTVRNVGLTNINVTALAVAGGIAGNNGGTVTDSYSTGSVTALAVVGGGLVGDNSGTVANSYSTGSVTGDSTIGGVVGMNNDTVSDCYFMGSIGGRQEVGGLIGRNDGGTVSGCHATGNIASGEEFGAMMGGLVGLNGGITSNSYAECSVTGGEVHGDSLGGLVGINGGSVDSCYATGNVAGGDEEGDFIGGLIGINEGTVSNSHSTGSVTGSRDLGGLVGMNSYWYGNVSNSYYNCDDALINGQRVITLGALFDADFEEWLANGKFLDVNERLTQENGHYLINDVDGFKQLLVFGQDASLKFRLTNNLDLSGEPNFYLPYLAGEFDGDGHKISNLSFHFDFISNVGLFGFLAPSGEVVNLGVENIDMTGYEHIGGLVGLSKGTIRYSHSIGDVAGDWAVGGLLGFSHYGTVSDCYAAGTVSGDTYHIGGLVGWNHGHVINSYCTGNVTGEGLIGGLVGYNIGDSTIRNSYATGGVSGSGYLVGGLVGFNDGAVSNSYSTGNVTGDEDVGGLVGDDFGTVTDSFWDIETSGQATSDGGTGLNTTEMKDIDTFSGVAWNITAVANPSIRNLSYIWNVVDDETYPFLSWQP